MVLCAAIKYEEVVIPCHHHYNGYEILHELGIKNYRDKVEEGFITTKNEFLNRKEAFIEAMNCGQLSAVTRQYKQDKFEIELFSEDLY